MKAWLDLNDRKINGESIDSKHIKKHKNDVVRLSELITAETQIEVPPAVFHDIQDFIEQIGMEDIYTKSLGLRRGKIEVLQRIKGAHYLSE